MVSIFVSIPGYRISEELYNGSRTLVYRGVRETDSLPVVIKLLKNPYPNFSELLSFRNQYTIAKNLYSPLIIQTYSLEPYQNGYALVMEDFGGISLVEWRVGGSVESLIEFLEIAIALCNTLEILYRERIIHKDIKPANILINPETKQVKLIDFSIASLLPRETQTLINPNVLEGTFAYISPEQTGRMNRGVDYRTDFYSLGVTFYELLTGELPFQSNDPMELLHCHIAKQPPSVIRDEIPQVISDIVMKLMAKNAEDRYQSALGLKFDLENCLHQLQVDGIINTFEIAQRDVCDACGGRSHRFIIPDKLYGRETEVQTLLDAFERVSLGNTELMLVAGFSGIGKTAVVNEVHKPIVRQRGYFIKGKYDQFQRNIPFSAFVQAFRDLMGQLLCESDAQLQAWKFRISAALGDSGQVLIEVIPELEWIIGTQPPATELSGSAAQNRFNLLIHKFVQVFTSTENPLVIFLDDWQWADSASLKLLQLLMVETRNLLVLGAYRDNEVSPAHPFILTVEEIVKTGAKVNAISLQPLSLVHLNQMVADTLKCELSQAQTLTELVYQKTQGNPFFATQFLKALHEDKHITFDWKTQHWQCDIAQIIALAITDDAVKFMALQLQKLPLLTQNILKLAACIGAQFDLNTLAIISEKSLEDAAADLWRALSEGLIIPNTEIYKFFTESDTASVYQSAANPTYRFLHDRVQQAAYSLIPDHQKQATHLQMGRLLLHNSATSEREERLFEIVNHLNVGMALISQPDEQENLAQLNLDAGRKAKTATAYGAATAYLATGIQLLPTDAWNSHYHLTLALHEDMAEASYLNIDFEQMEQWAGVVLQHANTFLDTSKVQQSRILRAKAQGQFLEAIQIGLEVLRSLGIEFPAQPTQADIAQALGATRSLWADKPPLDLLDLPTMSDPHLLAAMEILTLLVPAAYMGSPNFMPLLIGKQIELSIQSGNCAVSIFAYVDYGLILCGIVGDIENGYAFGELALSLLERLQLTSFKSRSWYVVYHFIKHWKTPLSETLLPLQSAYHIGLETGEMEMACFNAAAYCYYAYYAGQELTELAQKMNTYRQTIHQYQQTGTLYWVEIYQQTVFNLLGQSEVPYRLTGKIFDLNKSLSELQATNQRSALFMSHINQMFLYYLFGQDAEAAQTSAQTAQYLDGGVAMFVVPLYSFFDALIQLNQYAKASPEERQSLLLQVQEHQDKLHHWATLAPTNHQHRWELVTAEQDRVLGNKIAAIEAYDRAISNAKENNFIQDEALANELAAKFYLDWGKEKIAAVYMQEAYYCYTRWGAKAKVIDLEQRYPLLLAPILQQTPTPLSTNETIFSLATVISRISATSISSSLDLAAILKASQSLSSEIELEKLLSSLLHILIENAGADKCVLMLVRDERLLIKGSITAGSEPVVLQRIPIEDSQEIPLKLIYKVKHNRQTAVLIDASADPTLANDPYIIRQQPKSILCSPILHQGKLRGVLYLENSLVTGAFTSERVELFNLLCTQAAISLENAKLFDESKQAQINLRQSNAFLEAQRESALDGILVVDQNGQISSYNQVFLDIWKVPPALRNTRDDHKMLPFVVEQVADSQAFLDEVLYLYEHVNESSHCEWLLKDGRTIERRSVAVNSSNQENWGRIWYFRDISDRKQTEAALQQKEQFLRSIYNGAEILIIVTDVMADGSFRLAGLNPTAEKTIAITEIDFLGKTPTEIHGEEVGGAIQNIYTKCVKSGMTIATENLLNFNGEEKWFLATHNPLKNEKGEICRIITTAIDISDVYEELRLRKKAELALEQKSLLLEQALHNLQNAQLQMIQSEKMSALGNLVAGVAHEMNNPLGFIYASLQQTKPTVNDIVEHLKLYQQTFPNSSQEIINHAKKIDLEYTLGDLPKIIDSMNMACDRLQDISTSLRTFSRADRDYKVRFNIHEGIDSTILILKHRLKANKRRPAIEIVSNYGNLPKIECFSGQLNQVFMNILANAIDALDESNQGRSLKEIQANPNCITITTSIEKNLVKIAIADNGKGMSEQVKSKIFDHLFTTKAVGKGTGLGLAIARQIVEETHGGKLSFNSVLGLGTEFIIEIPV